MKRARKPEEDVSSPFASIVPGLNRFSHKLFEYLCLEEENNLVISPVGVAILLAMVADGAKGESLGELQSILHLPKDKMTVNSGYKSLMDHFNSFNSALCEIHVVNKIVTAETLEINEKFEKNMEEYFSSSVLAMDWTNPADICEAVNTFCKEKTKGRISSILTTIDVPMVPSVILLNAVYLKCAWDNKFDKELTAVEPFHVTSKLDVDVSMMHKRWDFDYGEIPELNATFIVVPLTTDKQRSLTRMKMMVFLPNELNGLKELEQHLGTVSFSKLLDSTTRRETYVSLPKFRVENSIDVTPILEKMGLKEVRDMDGADLTGISTTLPFCIDKVMQKTFLDVNETGVEAAAFTFARLRGGGPGSDPDVTFTVNRPFICAVVTEDDGIPIFMTKITNPTL